MSFPDNVIPFVRLESLNVYRVSVCLFLKENNPLHPSRIVFALQPVRSPVSDCPCQETDSTITPKSTVESETPFVSTPD